MDRALEIDVTTQLLDLMANPSMAIGDEMTEVPVAVYTDPERFAREQQRLFAGLPLLAGLSGELPEPGDWKLFEPPGTSLLLVRGDDGVVRGLRNACRHRGAPVVEEASGSNRSFTCPYHSWTYNRAGELVGVPQAETFPGLCREARGLSAVSVAERAGVLWVLPTSQGEPFDLDTHLGPFDAELHRWNLGDLHYFDRRVHRIAANWKLAVDTFTEGYHIPNLHQNTINMFAANGLLLADSFGRHHRQAVAMRCLTDSTEGPTETWTGFDDGGIGFVYLIFPNTILLFFGDHAELFQVFPDGIDHSVTVQSLYSYDPIETEDQRIILETALDFFYEIIGSQDYRMAAGVQRLIATGANETYLLGRCEALTQALHRDWAAATGY
ncbi:aromatic ring-hydroxylating oxygenase subunit alpha [Sporichthya polymorpha]|uniref:aromatic ring-hydroxylating oxygenase subunit alpha n=1 Tax=Sporichthya polymorpha TaxID=35751 RepID=UPI0003706033|nr:SRPBCC family protein [Sporichthya polymorpha]